MSELEDLIFCHTTTAGTFIIRVQSCTSFQGNCLSNYMKVCNFLHRNGQVCKQLPNHCIVSEYYRMKFLNVAVVL